jgi:hypothetical protein
MKARHSSWPLRSMRGLFSTQLTPTGSASLEMSVTITSWRLYLARKRKLRSAAYAMMSRTIGVDFMEAGMLKAFEQPRGLKAFDLRNGLSLLVQQLIGSICDAYLAGSPDEREEIHRQVSPEMSFLFFMFSKAMAEEAVRSRSDQPIVRGLAALAIEGCVFDSRDTTIALSLLFHSAQKVSANPGDLINRVVPVPGTRIERLFHAFLARTPDLQDIRSFGFKEGINQGEEFSYVPPREH